MALGIGDSLSRGFSKTFANAFSQSSAQAARKDEDERDREERAEVRVAQKAERETLRTQKKAETRAALLLGERKAQDTNVLDAYAKEAYKVGDYAGAQKARELMGAPNKDRFTQDVTPTARASASKNVLAAINANDISTLAPDEKAIAEKYLGLGRGQQDLALKRLAELSM